MIGANALLCAHGDTDPKRLLGPMALIRISVRPAFHAFFARNMLAEVKFVFNLIDVVLLMSTTRRPRPLLAHHRYGFVLQYARPILAHHRNEIVLQYVQHPIDRVSSPDI